MAIFVLNMKLITILGEVHVCFTIGGLALWQQFSVGDSVNLLAKISKDASSSDELIVVANGSVKGLTGQKFHCAPIPKGHAKVQLTNVQVENPEKVALPIPYILKKSMIR